MWLEIDESTDVIASLTVCSMCLVEVTGKPAFWKWAILTLHNALQGAMVCHLSGTAQLGALRDDSVEAQLDWHERDRRGEIRRVSEGFDELGIPKFRFATNQDYPPFEKLADPTELFKRLQNGKKRLEGGAGAVIEVSEAERQSFSRLNELRNEFTHFTPKGWSIELDGLPTILLEAVGIIDKIAADSWPFRHLEPDEHEQLLQLLIVLREQLRRLEKIDV